MEAKASTSRSRPAGGGRQKIPASAPSVGTRRSGRTRSNVGLAPPTVATSRKAASQEASATSRRREEVGGEEEVWGSRGDQEPVEVCSSRIAAKMAEYGTLGKKLKALSSDLALARFNAGNASKNRRPAFSARVRELKEEICLLEEARMKILEGAGLMAEKLQNQPRYDLLNSPAGAAAVSVEEEMVDISSSEEEEEDICGGSDESSSGQDGGGSVAGGDEEANEEQSVTLVSTQDSMPLPAGQGDPIGKDVDSSLSCSSSCDGDFEDSDDAGGALRETIVRLESPVHMDSFSFGEDLGEEKKIKGKKKGKNQKVKEKVDLVFTSFRRSGSSIRGSQGAGPSKLPAPAPEVVRGQQAGEKKVGKMAEAACSPAKAGEEGRTPAAVLEGGAEGSSHSGSPVAGGHPPRRGAAAAGAAPGRSGATSPNVLVAQDSGNTPSAGKGRGVAGRSDCAAVQDGAAAQGSPPAAGGRGRDAPASVGGAARPDEKEGRRRSVAVLPKEGGDGGGRAPASLVRDAVREAGVGVRGSSKRGGGRSSLALTSAEEAEPRSGRSRRSEKCGSERSRAPEVSGRRPEVAPGPCAGGAKQVGGVSGEAVGAAHPAPAGRSVATPSSSPQQVSGVVGERHSGDEGGGPGSPQLVLGSHAAKQAALSQLDIQMLQVVGEIEAQLGPPGERRVVATQRAGGHRREGVPAASPKDVIKPARFQPQGQLGPSEKRVGDGPVGTDGTGVEMAPEGAVVGGVEVEGGLAATPGGQGAQGRASYAEAASSPGSSKGHLQQRLLEALKKGERTLSVEGGQVDLSYWIERHGLGAFREKDGKAVWSLPTGGQEAGRRNVVRLLWRGREACPARSRVVELLFQMSFRATDIFALIHPYGSAEFDVSFVRAEGLELFWSNYELAKDRPDWRGFEVRALSRQVSVKRVTVLTRNESLSCFDIMTWLGRYGEVIDVPKKNLDEHGIWSGAWTFSVRLRRSGNTVTHIPSSAFLGRDRIQVFYQGQPKLCFKCGSPSHFSMSCPKQICALCGGEGHLAASCDTIRCNLCGVLGHAFAQCPASIVYVAPSRGEESRQVDSSGEGTSARRGGTEPVRKPKRKGPAKLRREEKRRGGRGPQVAGAARASGADSGTEALDDTELREEIRRLRQEEGEALSTDSSQYESLGEEVEDGPKRDSRKGSGRGGPRRVSPVRAKDQIPKESTIGPPLLVLSNRFQALDEEARPQGREEESLGPVAGEPLEEPPGDAEPVGRVEVPPGRQATDGPGDEVQSMDSSVTLKRAKEGRQRAERSSSSERGERSRRRKV